MIKALNKIEANQYLWIKSRLVRRVGFEPTNPCGIGASALSIGCLDGLKGSFIDFEAFKGWLEKNYRPLTVNPVYAYCKKYGHCLVNRNLSLLGTFTDGKRSAAVKSLGTLSKFLGMHDEFKGLLKKYGLKWSGRKSEDIIIDRLLRNPNDKELFEWIKKAREISELRNLLNLMIACGLRLIEGIECHNLIIKLSKEGNLESYYKRDRQVLEHFRFKALFIRNSKKVFISFVSAEIVDAIAKSEPVNYDRVQKLAECHLKRLHYADLRELFASLSTKHLRQPEIDFLQGRVSASVFIRNYFNPQFIGDLQERALTNSRELLAITREGKQPLSTVPSTVPSINSSTKACPTRNCQRLVSEAELPMLLADGWRVVTVLPSGKVVVESVKESVNRID